MNKVLRAELTEKKVILPELTHETVIKEFEEALNSDGWPYADSALPFNAREEYTIARGNILEMIKQNVSQTKSSVAEIQQKNISQTKGKGPALLSSRGVRSASTSRKSAKVATVTEGLGRMALTSAPRSTEMDSTGKSGVVAKGSTSSVQGSQYKTKASGEPGKARPLTGICTLRSPSKSTSISGPVITRSLSKILLSSSNAPSQGGAATQSPSSPRIVPGEDSKQAIR
ncbi:hypothetical protein NEOLEDRAFT_1117766, partial [Neolentinus lepideus HHB14362 ss-1]